VVPGSGRIEGMCFDCVLEESDKPRGSLRLLVGTEALLLVFNVSSSE